MGIPAIAFSGAGGSKHIYTEADPVADIYAQVATKLVTAIILSGPPFLPPGVGLVSIYRSLFESRKRTNLV